MTAEQMKLSMFRTWVQNKSWTHIPTHYIVGSDWSFVKVNDIDKIVWTTQNYDANLNWIHIEIVGNFNKTKPTEWQYAMTRQLIEWILDKHPWMVIRWHRDFQNHTCPWANFDFNEITKFIPIPHLSWEKRPLPYINGSNVKERTASFAKAYWYSYDWFINKSIKEEVLVCIAWAEWFGKDSWSENNIMNCWNNDRWNRVGFDSWTSSVKCAVDRLNWKWLWNKQTIWDLSYRWNWIIDMQFIYASSNSKREINVLNCLGKIYQKNISPSFEFRK